MDIRDLLRNRPTAHYYGDIIRILFITAGLIMLTALPLLGDLIPVPYFVSIILILTIVVLAGITNPVQKWVSLVNVLASTIAFIGFEFYAIEAIRLTKGLLFFSVNQVLAVIFFMALYYGTKTLRGKLQNKDKGTV